MVRLSDGDRRAFLGVAEGIAERICRSARRYEEGGEARCSWKVPEVRRPGRLLKQVEAGPYLYGGTSGIALFLIHLYRKTGKDAYLEAARGGLHGALSQIRPAPAVTGYYSGTAGVAAVCAAMASVDGSPRWLEEASALGKAFGAGFKQSDLYDVMAGEAGSLLGLLQVHAVTGDLLDEARRLGDRLLEKRRHEPDGISWDVMHPSVVRNLTGLSHGAGGIAMALLELYRWTAEPAYLAVAVQALHYEDSLADVGRGSWPDLRNAGVARYLEADREAELIRDLVAGRSVSEASKMMEAWCHGPPGIGLVRSRFLSVTSEGRFASSLDSAAARTLKAVADWKPGNHSLCHGLYGNADVLLELARRHDRPRFFKAALDAARLGVEVERTGGVWLSGFEGRVATPGLMLGEAGVGLFFLRLVDPEVPSCLLPVPCRAPVQEPSYDVSRLDFAIEAGYRSHFPRTSRLLEALGVKLSKELPRHHRGFLQGLRDTVDCVVQALEEGAVAERLQDVLSLEATAFEMTCARQDFSEAYLRTLVRPNVGLLERDETLLQLAAGSRLLEARWSGERLLAAEAEPDGPVAGPSLYLLYEADHSTRIRLLDGLAVEMYSLLKEPIPIAALIDSMVARMRSQCLLAEGETGEDEAVRASLHATVRNAYLGEMIDIVEPHDLEPDDVDGELCVRCGRCCRVQVHVPGDGAYADFLREMLEEPLRSTFPEARVYPARTDGPAYAVIDLGDCRHLRRSSGEDGEPELTCQIYRRRPQTCRDFNCITWWRELRLKGRGSTEADAVIERVAALKGREPVSRPGGGVARSREE